MHSTKNEQQMLSLVEKILTARNSEVLLAADKITSDERNAIIEVITAELCEKGFGTDSEPTAYGQELEWLIDYLNRPNLR